MSSEGGDFKAKEDARAAARASKPGAVAVASDEAARLDQRIAEKQQGGVPSVATAASSMANKHADDVEAKQRGARPAATPLKPGAYAEAAPTARSQLESLEGDIAAKVRTSGSGAASIDPAAAKIRRDNVAAPASLANLEDSLNSKVRSAAPPAMSPGVQNVAPATLTNLEDSLTEKARASAPSTKPGATQMLQGLEDSIAAKVHRDSGVEPAAGAQAHLQTMEDAVASKVRATSASQGSSELSQLEGRIQSKLQASEPHVSAQQELSQFEDRILSKENVTPKSEINPAGGSNKVEGLSGGKDVSQDPLQPDVTTTVDRGIASAPDLEYGTGMVGGEGLAVAIAVEEVDEDIFIPSAIEYDPDSKPPLYKNRRFRLYAFLAFFTIVVVAIGASIATALAGPGSSAPPPTLAPTTDREATGIRPAIGAVVGSDQLDDPESPYSKALDWILFDDPMELTPADENLVQRYIAAYLYFATTVEGPWTSCNPPKNPRTDPPGCLYHYLTHLTPTAYDDVQSIAWLSSASECSWAGVTCDENGVIRTLDLGGVSMTGAFPEGVVYLPFLQDVNFLLNNLTGTIPPSLFKMEHLINVQAHFNKLTGRIPDELWQATNLQKVNLGKNMLTGSIPTEIGNFRDMKGLFLYSNQLHGTIPDEIGQLESLMYLYLHTNQLEGSIPSTITSLQNLWRVTLSNNMLTGTIPDEIGNLRSQLINLELAGNPLHGDLPESLYELSALTWLDLSQCNFTGTIPPDIGKLTNLGTLKLSDNHFEGQIPANVSDFVKIGTMWLNGNDFTGSVPQSLCDARVGTTDGFLKDVLKDLQADCAPDTSGNVEISCADGCCTTCCLPDGTGCVSTESSQ